MPSRMSIALLALVLVVAGCAGSAGQTDDAGGLVFWTAEDDPARVEGTRAIIDRFTEQTDIAVKLVPYTEDKLQSELTRASAAGAPPDVVGALSLGAVHSLAVDGLTDPDAAAAVVNRLGRETFSSRGLDLVEEKGKPVAVPSDSWTQLLIYRKDLFRAAGLPAPTTLTAIRTAAARLHSRRLAGIVAGTETDSFTLQTFEDLALANGCELTSKNGDITLTSTRCVETFRLYADLVRNSSVGGGQNFDTTRAAYLGGRAGMVIWSSFLLDELAGLSDDAPPTCSQCRADRSFLARNSGFVTAISGPPGTQPSQFGELTSFAISKGAKREEATRFIEFMMGDGYLDWLALAPEGKFPVRRGTTERPQMFSDGWRQLKTGTDRSEKLSDIYPPDVLAALTNSTDTMRRWGFPQGQGRLVAALQGQLPVPRAVIAAVEGTLTPAAAAEQAQAEVAKIARPIQGDR